MRRSVRVTSLVCAMGVVISACAFTTTKVVENVLVETPRGAVFLQYAEDGWFRTAHPFALSPEVLTTVFRGVHVQPASIDAASGSRVFSDEDAEFLSPLMSTALSKATTHQVVGFRVRHDVDGGQETTGGFVYVQGRLLHLTLTHFRARPDRAEPDGRSQKLNPNPMGLDQKQITFSPEAASRSSRHEQPDITAVPPLASLVLDYEALIEGAALPDAAGRAHPIRADKGSVFQQILDPALPTSKVPSALERSPLIQDTTQTGQMPSPEKEGELETLKAEMRTLQRRISEIEGQTRKTKQPEPLFKP